MWEFIPDTKKMLKYCVGVDGNTVVINYPSGIFINKRGLSVDDRIHSTSICWTPYYVPKSSVREKHVNK